MKVGDLVEHLRNLRRKLDEDEGLVFGDKSDRVEAIQVSWMATVGAIEEARRSGANAMLVHEALFYPYPFSMDSRPGGYLTWVANAKPLALLSRYRMAVVRFHGTLDEICVFEDFARALDLRKPSVEEEGFVRLYDIDPVTVEDMIARVKKALGLDRVRVTRCDPGKKARRIGLPWGGMALLVNVGYVERLLRHHPDLLIAGETDSYVMHLAIDAGVVLIETSHEVSENVGLKNFAEKLKRDLKGVPVTFYENKQPWVTY